MDIETKIAFEFLEDLRGKGKIKDKTTDLENNISKEFEEIRKVIPQESKNIINDIEIKIFGIMLDVRKEYFELGVLFAESLETVKSEVE